MLLIKFIPSDSLKSHIHHPRIHTYVYPYGVHGLSIIVRMKFKRRVTAAEDDSNCAEGFHGQGSFLNYVGMVRAREGPRNACKGKWVFLSSFYGEKNPDLIYLTNFFGVSWNF